MDNKQSVKLGDGVADKVKDNINKNISEALTMLSNIAFDYLKKKIQEIPQEIEKILGSAEAQEEILTLWSTQLCERGLISKSYNGLSEELLIYNFRQDGYLSGLYAGYVLAMMSLVDNNAERELIISVRDDMRPVLTGQHYNDRDEFYKKYKNETYSWIEKAGKTR